MAKGVGETIAPTAEQATVSTHKLLTTFLPAYLESSRITDLTGEIEDLGIPFKESYPSGDSLYARNVWDLKLHAGKILIGAGNSSNEGPAPNAGPVRAIVYDIQSGAFREEGKIDEEQVDLFRVLGGQLYVPGHDPRENWDFGNYYLRSTQGTWNKYRNIPVALHNYDLALNDGVLYAALGVDGGGAILRSTLNNGSWIRIYQGKHRMYSFLKVNDELFATSIFVSNSSWTPEEVGGGLVALSGTGRAEPRYDINVAEIFPETSFSQQRVLKIVRTQEYGRKGVYIGAYRHNDHQFRPFGVYVAASLKENDLRVRRVPLPAGARPWDLLVDKGDLYILLENHDEKPGRLIQVLKTPLVSERRPKEIFRFRYDTFARSFEIVNGDFYFGMGCEITNPLNYRQPELSPQTGRILRIRHNAIH